VPVPCDQTSDVALPIDLIVESRPALAKTGIKPGPPGSTCKTPSGDQRESI
jgi:hypothetical protein